MNKSGFRRALSMTLLCDSHAGRIEDGGKTTENKFFIINDVLKKVINAENIEDD